MIATMDETGFCQFASSRNVAARARVSDESAAAALTVLESPDKDSGDPDNEGRRLERVPGGWLVLNAEKYRDIVTRAISQERTRERVRRHRERKSGNAHVTPRNDSVTPSRSEAVSEAETKKQHPVCASHAESLYELYPRKEARGAAIKAIEDALRRVVAGEMATPLTPVLAFAALSSLVTCYADSPAGKRGKYTPHAATWFNQSRYLDDQKQWQQLDEKPNPNPRVGMAPGAVATQKVLEEYGLNYWRWLQEKEPDRFEREAPLVIKEKLKVMADA